MFYLVTNHHIKCFIFQTHARSQFGIHKKKTFQSPRRSSSVRTVLVWGGMTARGLTRLHFVPQHTSINSEYYVNSILKKELKPVYNRLNTSGAISKRRLFTDNVVSFFQQDGGEHIHLLFREDGWMKIFLTTLKTGLQTLLISHRLKISRVYSQTVSTRPRAKNSWSAKHRLRKAWNSISLETLHNLIESLPDEWKLL